MELSIVLPTYNERENIEILIPQLEDFLSGRGISGEIIVVDDSSPDGTAESARELNKRYGNVVVLVREKKEGLGAALRDAYNAARGDLIMSMDSDLSFNIEDVGKLLAKIDEGFDLVVGSRHSIGGVYKKKYVKTFIKNVVSQVGNKFTRIMIGCDINDYSLNFRVMRKKVWESIETKENLNTFLLETILQARDNGFKVTEVAVTFKDRVYGKSKMNMPKQAGRFLYKVIQLKLRSLLREAPPVSSEFICFVV